MNNFYNVCYSEKIRYKFEEDIWVNKKKKYVYIKFIKKHINSINKIISAWM